MRYELAEYEWLAIRPMQPNKPQLATRSSDSSTGSDNVVGWRRATTSAPPATLPLSNSHLSGYGWPLVVSPSPS
jgi:hypothetical protein